MTYRYKQYGKVHEVSRDLFIGFLCRKFNLELVVAQNLLAIAESEGKRTLFVPAERGSAYRKKLEKCLLKTEELIRDSKYLRVPKPKKVDVFDSPALAVIRNSLTTEMHPVVDSTMRFMRESVGDGIAVTETGLEASGSEITPESLSGTLARFCAAKNGVDQSSSLFAWSIGDACNMARALGYYKASMYPTISQVTGIAVNHLKKMAHFSKIVPPSNRIPGWPQARYQQLVPVLRKMTPKQISDALGLLEEGDSVGAPLKLKEILAAFNKSQRKPTEPKQSKPCRYLFITPAGIWQGHRFLASVARNPRSRVVDLERRCVLDVEQEVLYRIRPACAETSRDAVMGLFGFSFDEGVLEESEKMVSLGEE